MWRALFLALGIFICVIGLECLVVDKFVFAQINQSAPADAFAQSAPAAPREILPPPWAPWTLLATGAVVIISSFTIPRRIKG